MSELRQYMRAQRYKDKVHNSVRIYEKLMGIEVSESTKKSVIKYMERKIDYHVKEGSLITGLLAIATVALIKLKMESKK